MSSININTIERRLSPAPPGLIFTSLLLWGWQTEFLLSAIIMGILIELPYFINWRIDLSDKDINQLADLSGILFFLISIYAFNTHSFQGIYKILELLPFALILLIFTQAYSTRKGIKTSALFISIRRLGESASPDVLYETDISLPYVFICLISASAGNKYSDFFFLFSSLLIIWILWSFRPKHFSIFQWVVPILLVFCISYLTQNGLRQLQESAEIVFLSFFEQYGWKSRDPNLATTSIGSLGRLKLSDRIVMRLKSEQELNTPLYFREISYSVYEYGMWRNPHTEFDVIPKTPNRNEWRINKQSSDIGNIDIGLYLNDKSAIIPAPDNINKLTGKDLIQVETSVYGSTRIEAREGWIKYRLSYTDQNFIETTPDPEDLFITPNYAEDFKTVATKLQLYSKPANDIVSTIENYFKENFYYSITQNQRYPKGKYLSKFLFENKKGHCEYFATATALLLREAGIPARYTIGYSVQEYSPWQGMYLIRSRHAHSWVEYYMNNKWHILDTTPSVWAPMEAEDKTLLEPVMDMLSWLRYKITGNDIDNGKQETNNWFLWLLIPLGGYLAWRFYNKKLINKVNISDKTCEATLERYGMDSPLYSIIQKLEKQKDNRSPGETLTTWIKRILPNEDREQYIELIKLHYHYRFNPVSNKVRDKQLIIEKLKQTPYE